MAINKGYLTCNRTESGDEVYTPYYAVAPLLEFLKDRSKIIWCPFDEKWSAFYQTFVQGGGKLLDHLFQREKTFLPMNQLNGIF